jgi:hypothetical protein
MCLRGARERIPAPPLHSQHPTAQRREGLLRDLVQRGALGDVVSARHDQERW